MTPPPTWTELGSPSSAGLPLLVVGPSLGTSVDSLWGRCAAELSGDFRVIGWQLPGHGGAASATGFTVADLAKGIRESLDSLPPGGAGDRHTGVRFYYAGVSVGAAVGLQLVLDAPDRLAGAALAGTGPRIGEPVGWLERAEAVRAGGTKVLLAATPGRWFGAGFVDRAPETASRLLTDLAETDPESYAAVCEALAEFDVRDRLSEISTPVLAIAGAEDVVAPPARLRHLAAGVQWGTLSVLEGVAHLAPAESPARVAKLIRDAFRPGAGSPTGETGHDSTVQQVRAEGMRVRREVLGDEHVDRAGASATEFSADFQSLISQYAWGTIWTRQGLDRRSRSLITLSALVARGHHDELAVHVRAALTNGVTKAELAELFLQTAIYCGVPDANTAFRIAQRVLAENGQDLPTAPPPQDQ